MKQNEQAAPAVGDAIPDDIVAKWLRLPRASRFEAMDAAAYAEVLASMVWTGDKYSTPDGTMGIFDPRTYKPMADA